MQDHTLIKFIFYIYCQKQLHFLDLPSLDSAGAYWAEKRSHFFEALFQALAVSITI